MAPLPAQINSGGGAVFVGDRNAGRDIYNIEYNITNVRPLARSLHRSLYTSSDQFKSVQNDISHLMTILETITEEDIEIQKEPAVCSLAKDSYQTLQDLLEVKEHYDSVTAQTQLAWEREQWRAEDLSEIRARLTSTTSALNNVYIKWIHSSNRAIMAKLDRFIEEVRSGKRQSLTGTYRTTDSLTLDQKQDWRALRKELESVGVTPALFSQHRDLIIARVQEAVKDGILVGVVPAEDVETADNAETNLLPIAEEDASPEVDDVKTQSDAVHSIDTTPAPTSTVYRTSSVKRTGRISRFLARVSSGGRRSKVDATTADAAKADAGNLMGSDERRVVEACEKGDQDLAQELLRIGADVNSKDKKGMTILMWAASEGAEDVLSLILEMGNAEVESRCHLGRTALSHAAEKRNENVIKQLVELGNADVNSKDNSHWTPLMYAADSGKTAVVKTLLETGKVEADSKDTIGRTPLSRAATYGYEAIVDMLLRGDVDVNSQAHSGRTPLSYAAELGYAATVTQLHEKGNAKPDVKDSAGRSPLSFAAERGRGRVVKALLKTKDVDVDSTETFHNRTPLWYAAMNGHIGTAKLLLEIGGAEADCVDSRGRTPLMVAAEAGHLALVRLLLDSGRATVNISDRDGHTALSLAEEGRHYDIVRLLSEAPALI